jgi:hypothetical protein
VTRLLRWSSTVYGNLLRVCPEELRKDFGAEMALVFSDDLRDAWLKAGIQGVIRVWLCASGELLQIGLSNACAAPRFIVALISCAASAICLGGELALARAHASPGANTPPLADAIWAVVVWPSLAAALVSFTAVFVGARSAPHNTLLPLIAPEVSKAGQTERV